MSEQLFYSRNEVAKITGVSSPTVKKWIDSGMLPAFTLPGSKHVRVQADHLAAFIEKHKMPAAPKES